MVFWAAVAVAVAVVVVVVLGHCTAAAVKGFSVGEGRIGNVEIGAVIVFVAFAASAILIRRVNRRSARVMMESCMPGEQGIETEEGTLGRLQDGWLQFDE